MSTGRAAWDAWVQVTAARLDDIVNSPLASQLYSLGLAVAAEKDLTAERAVRMGEQAAAALQAELTEAKAEIARLKADQDGRKAHQVYHSMERDFPLVQAQLGEREVSEGDIIRATDTGQELVWMEGSWQDQR